MSPGEQSSAIAETPGQQERFGAGCIADLSDVLQEFAFESLFLVTGHRSFEHPSLQAALAPLLEQYPSVRFKDFAKNPQVADIEAGIAQVRRLKNPLVLAVGGGSVLDMAKLIAFFAGCQSDVQTYFKTAPDAQDKPDVLPLVAVPTTAGTGSEATQFATLYIDKVKFSLDTPAILPEAVLLDPTLTATLPARETAESGMDALTQAIESYWNVKATPETQAFAAEAIRLIHPNLHAAVTEPSPQNRAAMLQGANLAGKAICQTRTTAAHAISYPMTAHFDIPHGQAVGLSLPHFLAFNAEVSEADVLDARGMAYVQKTLRELLELLGAEGIAEAKENLIALMQSIGLKTDLKSLGIEPSDWDVIVANGFNPQRVKNNPRNLTEPQLRVLLEAFGG